MRDALFAVAALFGLASAASGPPVTATATGMLLDTAWTFDEQIVALTLQGLANRASPAVWLFEPVFWTNNESTWWFATQYLPSQGITVQNVSGICNLYNALPSTTVTGVALFNADLLDASRWLALTASGLHNLVPLTDATLSALPCFSSLPIVVDYRNATKFGWTSDVAAYEWGMHNLLPLCDSSRVYSAGHSYNDSHNYVFLGGDPAIDIGLDLAIAGRFFIFNLSPDSTNYPVDAAAWVALVAAVAATANEGIPSVFGWSEPEPDMTGSTSKGGGAIVCDGAPNLSFWTHVNNGTTPKLPYNRLVTELNRQAHYIAWQTNEVCCTFTAVAINYDSSYLSPFFRMYLFLLNSAGRYPKNTRGTNAGRMVVSSERFCADGMGDRPPDHRGALLFTFPLCASEA
jgi:hypothetical protein